jgi:hypothetical protein
MDMKDGIKPQGRVEVFVTKGKPDLKFDGFLRECNGLKLYSRGEIDVSQVSLIDYIDIKNIVVNQGKDKVITALVAGAVNPIGRMAIGDRGTIPSDPTVPKVPVGTMTALYNEVYRADIDGVIIDVGTPSVHEARFVKTFSAIEVPIASFSNQAKPVINEVGLTTYDPATPLPRAPVAAPNPPPADEALFSIRTFKSVPFEAANEISITIRYTIFIA